MNSGLTAFLIILFLALAAAQLAAIVLMEKEAMRQKIDQEQAARNQEALESLSRAIVDIPSLAFEIVQLWLEKNDYLLYPKEREQP